MLEVNSFWTIKEAWFVRTLTPGYRWMGCVQLKFYGLLHICDRKMCFNFILKTERPSINLQQS